MPGLELPIGMPLEALTSDLNGAKTKLRKSVSEMEDILKSFKDKAKQSLDPNVIAQFNAKAQILEGQISRLSNVGKTGFDSMGVAIEKTAEKTSNGLTKAFSGLRSLAYILPGIGIAGIFNLGFEALSKLATELELFKSQMTETKLAADTLGKAFEATDYVNAVKNVYELTTNIDLAKKGLISKEGVLKEYNETIGKTTGLVSTLDQAEIALTKNAPAYIRSMYLKAAAQIALTEAANKRVQSEKIAADQEVSFFDKTKALFQSFGKIEQGKSVGNFDKDAKSISDRRKAAEAKALKDEADSLVALFKKLQGEAATATGNFNFFDDTKAPKGAKGKESPILHDILPSLPDAQFQGKKIAENIYTGVRTFAQLENSQLGAVFTHLGKVAFQPIQAAATESFNYIGTVLIPQLASGFTTFFDDILMHGKLNFEALGKAIISTFTSILASDAVAKIGGLLGGKDLKGDKLGSGKGNIFNAGKGLLGMLLPAAGIALGVGSIIGSIFKKKETPIPAIATSVSTNSGIGSGIDLGGGRVVFEISGTNLIGVLNRAGASLSRYKGG